MLSEEIKKRFFENTDETGRFAVTSFVTGKTYYVETIGTRGEAWGSIDPATGKLTHKKGDGKYTGGVNKNDSLINEENGFENIITLEAGQSPFDEINRRDKEYELLMKKD